MTEGHVCYVREITSAEGDAERTFWSVGFQPSGRDADSYEETLRRSRILRRRDGPIETFMEVAVSPEDDAEIRRMSTRNTRARSARSN